MKVAVLTPVLGRPQRVAPLVESIRDTSRTVQLIPVFLCSPEDRPQIDAIRDAEQQTELLWEVMGWDPGPGDYARKMNYGIGWLGAQVDYVFLGADDLVFHPGWIERALAKQFETNACVVGTNDLGNNRTVQGRHSTHTLVHSGYLQEGTIDDPDLLLHEGYDHNFVDDEFVQTATYRGTFVHATDAVVEHLHPDWGKGPGDPTYKKGKAHFAEDRLIYTRRSRLWGGGRR